jgi:hypothetical protein
MRKWHLELSWTVLLSALVLCFAALAQDAAAKPSTLQRFSAGLVSSNKAGSAAKPAAVGLAMRPYHVVGLEGGPKNELGLNSGAILESPAFSTVFASILLPKQLKFNLATFPGCSDMTILQEPSKCVKGSEIGLRNKDPKCGSVGKSACSVYATGVVRSATSQLNPDISGLYVLKTTLSIQVFVMNSWMGKKVKDNIALRVLSPLTGNVLIRGQLSKVAGAEAKQYGSKMVFSIPSGLISPTPGLVSQLTDFNAGLQRVSRSGKPLVGLTSCPKSKKLSFGYSGQYNINAARRTDIAGQPFTIDETGPVISSKVNCRS